MLTVKYEQSEFTLHQIIKLEEPDGWDEMGEDEQNEWLMDHMWEQGHKVHEEFKLDHTLYRTDEITSVEQS